MSSKKVKVLYSTDRIARLVYTGLLQDFRTVYGPSFRLGDVLPAKGKMSEFRDRPQGDYIETPPEYFKAMYQMDSLLKKYTFEDDKYDTAQLESLSIKKYVGFQVKRSTYKTLSYRTRIVLQRARQIAKEILGDFDEEEVFKSCRFGRKSSIGCSLANSYLDHKLSTKNAFTGSVDVLPIFDKYCLTDSILSRILSQGGLRYMCAHKDLILSNVPKTWKINRIITPLQLLNLWYSYGYGVVVEGRLKEKTPITITKQQARHQKWIRNYSMDRRHATVDLSSASDNLTTWLLNMVLPRKWYVPLKRTFSHNVHLMKDDKGEGISPCYTESVLPMGNGATFPVETLIFYCLIRAIGDLSKINGNYSVYGDDIILPSKALPYLRIVLDDLGIGTNKDKTFAKSGFRESCGADFHSGIAVRPFFMPPGIKYSRQTSSRLVVYLHKTINGLLRRWEPFQIRYTLRSLLIELTMACGGKVLLVPPSFPDTSGIKVENPDIPLTEDMFPWAFPKVGLVDGTRQYFFSYYQQMPQKRAVIREEPYYWDVLRSAECGDEPEGAEDWTKESWQEKTVDDILTSRLTTRQMFSLTKERKIKFWRDRSGRVRKDTQWRYSANVAQKQTEVYELQTLRPHKGVEQESKGPLISFWTKALVK